MQQELLPLFPLQLVLLPHNTVELHIFEDRYKEMIGEAIDAASEFGIVLAGEKGIVNMGCTAVVDKVLKKYPDGRMDIEVGGRRRFEILMLNEEKSYLRGAVEFFDDDDDTSAPMDLRDRALEGYKQLMELEEKPFEIDPKVPLSFQIGRAVADLGPRQILLSTRSESDRLRQLAEYFPARIVRLEQTAHVKNVAPSNGHSRWPAGL